MVHAVAKEWEKYPGNEGKYLVLPWAPAREGATSKAVEMRQYASLKESVRKILREVINIKVTHTYTLGMSEKEGALAQGQTEREKSWNQPRCSSPGSRRLLGWRTSSYNIYTFPTWVWLHGLWRKINTYLSSKCLQSKNRQTDLRTHLGAWTSYSPKTVISNNI